MVFAHFLMEKSTQEGLKMKVKYLVIPLIGLLAAGCASSGYLVDDIYYDPTLSPQQEAVTPVQDEGFVTADNADEGFEAIQQYPDENQGDTLQLSPEEAMMYDNQGNVIINNYGMDYGARIRRFYYPTYGFSYFDPFFYDPLSYYDPFYTGYYSPGFSLGFGYSPLGFYNPMYYSPFYYSSYYYGYGGYWGGYYGGYYGGYGYNPYYREVSYNDKGVTYGHRRSVASNRNPYSSTGGSVKSSFIPSDSRRVSGGTRSSGSRIGVTSSRRSVDQSATGIRTTTTKTATQQPASRRTSSSGVTRTTRLPQNQTRTTTTTRRTTTTQTSRSGRTYVPRYSNTRTTTRPSYNTTRSVRTNRTPVVKSVSPPVRRSSSTYTPVRRSSGSRSTYRPSSSGSSGRSYSGSSVTRSSSSSSRSSSSSGRRR